MYNFKRKNAEGMSLIEITISLALMSIMILLFSTLMVNQNRETRSLQEKLAALDLERILIAALANGSVCTYLTAGKIFDSTNLPATISLPVSKPIRANVSLGPPVVLGPVVAKIGTLASPVSNSLKINSIELQINSGQSGFYNATWVVGLDSDNPRAIKPVTISSTLMANDSAPTVAVISNCQISGGGIGPYLPKKNIYFPAPNGWVVLPGPYPTITGTSSDEIKTLSYTYVPRGSRLNIKINDSQNIIATAVNNNLTLNTYIYVRKFGGATTKRHIGGMFIDQSTLSFGQVQYFETTINVIPNAQYEIQIGVSVNCAATATCDPTGLIMKAWSPAAISIQEYY